MVTHDGTWSERLGGEPGTTAVTTEALVALAHPQDLPRCGAALSAHVNGDSPFYEVEYRLRDTSGEWSWVLARGRVVKRADDGTALTVAGFSVDITDRKKTEEQRRALDTKLQQAQRLESLRALAGRVAHDFNNVLMAVLSNASLCLDSLHSAADVSRYVGRIENAVARASDLSCQLMAFAAAPGSLNEQVDLLAEARHVVEARRRTLPRRVRVELASEESVPAIEGDPHQLRQAIDNLLANAIEATMTGGEVTVSIGTAACEPPEEGEGAPSCGDVCVRVQVSDTGAGMDGAAQASAFDPLFSTKSPGRGLGLAAVLGVARSHGARVKLDSEPGVGTTVGLDFPVARAEPATAVGSAREARAGWSATERPTVLVADDEEVVRGVVAEALGRAGFTVLVACDGEEALELLEERGGAVAGVLLDMVMPVKTGAEVFAEMRALYPDVPVIVSSGYREAEMRSRLGDLCPNGILQKPYELTLLVDTMRALTSEGGPDAGP
jgi:signal transduction histidine kinase/CheY-like chemotaxis protein